MCGIAGMVRKKKIDLELLCRMAGSQRHRGPDDEGYTLLDASGKLSHFRGQDSIDAMHSFPHILDHFEERDIDVGLAHRRLSIIDLSPLGHQPMEYEGRYVITYNGEIYNYLELKNELADKGFTFRSDSDTEVILASYQAWGDTSVSRFIGMWAFAVIDVRSREVFLSRDRFGIKPLYYAMNKDGFYFSSEIKSLLQNSDLDRKIIEKKTYNYLCYGDSAGPHETLFEGIFELPPGWNMVYSLENHEYNLKKYYDLHDVVSCYNNFNGSNYLEKYSELFANSIRLHLRSDVPVGSCLSGGLDSSAIVALCAHKNGEGFNTFTAAYEDKLIDESVYAHMVEAHYQNIKGNCTYPQSEDFWDEWGRLTWHQDLPIGSTSMFAQWEVMRLASSQGMKVLLDGQGADESLGGYSFYGGIFLLETLKKFRIFDFIKESKALKQNRSINTWNELGRAMFPNLPGILKKAIHSRKRIGSRFLSPRFRSDVVNNNIDQAWGDDFRDASIQNIRIGLHELLRYEDRNSMAFSIESRVPFLDHRLVEFSIFLPIEWKIRNGWTKYILRKTIESYLPYDVVWRRDKKGFITPQKTWKEEQVKKLSEYLSDYSFPDMLDKSSILDILHSEINDPVHLTELWRLFSFLKWLEVYQVRLN